MASTNPISLPELTHRLDESPWNGYRSWVLALASLAIILDGFDNQILGFAIPALIEDWGVSRGDFPIILAISLIAMSIGTALAGVIGDRIGRRPALIGSVLLFGIATTAIAFVNDLQTLTVFRAIAALGLGGAMPNATALLAEFSPLQRRNLAVSLGIVCVPVGGLGGGLIAAFLLPAYGWRALFLVGGLMPLVVGFVMLFVLPESPSFLMKDAKRRPALQKLIRKLGVEGDLSATEFKQQADVEPERGPASALFQRNHIRDTMALWLAFFAALLAVYSVFNWVPTLMTSVGFDLAMASTVLAMFNLGGIFGAIGGAWLMDRYGSRWPTFFIAATGAVLAAIIALMDFDSTTDPMLVIASMTLLGVFIPGFQVMLFSLAASVYPVTMRATGVGAALAFGRSGAVVSSYAGAAVIGVGPTAYFFYIAGSMALAALGVLLVRAHFARSGKLGPGGLADAG